VGGNQAARAAGIARCAIAAVLTVGAVGCSDEPADVERAVQPADAYVAVVEWEVGRQDPVVDDDGEVVLPVVFVASGDGSTIDVGVQAAVAEATSDWAKVRFADQPSDAFDPSVEGEPVRDAGAMLLIGPIPDAAPSIEVQVLRSVAVDESEAFLVEVTATPGPIDTSAISPRATVTSVSSVTAVTTP
jgi:hypothetical protein